MSYTPTNWQTGDTITAAKMNKLEQGVADAGGGGGLVVNVVENPGEDTVLDKTAAEISAAADTGCVAIKRPSDDTPGFMDYMPVTSIGYFEGMGYLIFTAHYTYIAATAADYPVEEK